MLRTFSSVNLYLLTEYCRCKAEGAKAYCRYFEPRTTQQMRFPVSRYGSKNIFYRYVKLTPCVFMVNILSLYAIEHVYIYHTL